MADARAGDEPPTRTRMVIATVIVVLTVVGVWKLIDFRSQPPPPPNRVSTSAAK